MDCSIGRTEGSYCGWHDSGNDTKLVLGLQETMKVTAGETARGALMRRTSGTNILK